MRGRTIMTGTAVALLLLTGCGKAGTDGLNGEDASPSASALPPYGAKFLGYGECAAPVEGGQGEDVYREVPCTAPGALGKVISRWDTQVAHELSRSQCPEDTDFLVDVPAGLRALPLAERGTDPPAAGYACLRRLTGPHPSDVGQGGGPGIRIGDCVKVSGQAVAEAACAAKDATHRIRDILTDVRRNVVLPSTSPCAHGETAIATNKVFDSDLFKDDEVHCAVKLTR
ncbi:hypothetical protein ABZ135_19535 [Streptomyces sp. NPDC006339]|uniref:hypothetical protein n=1 Tax=Streptomyces sp. NPDC006339 TaxID=3156755 RepID=UPI0033AD9F4D